MTATAHALVAGAIAVKFADPVTAATLAITSHFIMDAIPHWDVGTNWRNRAKEMTAILAILETLFGTTIAYLVFMGKAPTITLLAAIAASLLPDWLETPWYIFYAKQSKHEPAKSAGVGEKLSYLIYKAENKFHTKAQYPFGLVTQIAAVIFFLKLLS